MIELTKYDSEYISKSMKLISYLMLIILSGDILIPIIGQLFNSEDKMYYILGYISYLSIGCVIIYLIFELRRLVLEEIQSA